VSSISRSHRQRSPGAGVKNQAEPCQRSGDAGVSSITRNTTLVRAPGRNRTSAHGLGNGVREIRALLSGDLAFGISCRASADPRR